MKIASDNLFVRQLKVGKLAVFSYVVADRKSREGLIIDPGGSPGKILNAVNEDGIRIQYIVNTHSHNDHIAFNAETLSKTGAQLIVHELEAKSLTKIYKGIFNRVLGGRPSPKPNMLVKDGDSIRIGGSTLEVIHTPGHSKGGICLYCDNNLFTGDTLFVGGIGRTDLPGGSLKVLLHSIKKKLLVLPDETIVWPGHNYGTTPYSKIMNERFHNPFLAS